MRVSTKELFSLISKADTKNVKEALAKIAVGKTDISQSDKIPKAQQIKHQSTMELIDSLFKDISSKTKSKESVLTTLKQNDIPKSMKTTTQELTTLLNLVKDDKTLAKFAPALGKLLTHVKDIAPQNIKASLEKSGVFFESKLASKTTTLTAPIKEVLLDLKELVAKNLPRPELHVKQIDNLLNAKKADKSFIDTLVNLIKDLKQSKEIPRQIEPMLQKLASIIKKEIPLASSNVKEVLADLKQTLVENKSTSNLHVKIIDKLLDAPKADKSFIADIKTLIINLKESKNLDKPIVNMTAKLEVLVKKSELLESKIQNMPLAKETVKIASEAQKEQPKEASKVANEIVKQSTKEALNVAVKTQSEVSKETLKLPNEISKELPKEILKVSNEIKSLMSELKELALNSSSKKAPIILEKSQEIVQLVDQTLKIPNFFSNDLQKATISEQIQRVVNLLKTEMSKSDIKAPVNVEIAKLTQKLESSLKTAIENKTIIPNQKLLADTPIKNEIANDMKATLLNMKQELSTSTLPAAREVLTQIDRLLTQIDYFQLVSLSSNTTTYLPFSWEGLKEGQISLKKLKENRFFCEINLKLKEYGKIDLMIMLYEDVNINVSVFAEKKEFISLIQENLLELKQGINKLGLIPSNIQLFDGLKDKKLKEDTRNFVNSATLGAGLNLEV